MAVNVDLRNDNLNSDERYSRSATDL